MPEKWKPSYDTYKQSLVDILVRAGVIYPPTVTNGSDRPELLKARTQHNDLVEQIRSAETRKEDTEQQLDKDWGRDWEWKKLEGTCVEQNTGEYVFRVVPAEAAQPLHCGRIDSQADWSCLLQVHVQRVLLRRSDSKVQQQQCSYQSRTLQGLGRRRR